MASQDFCKSFSLSQQHQAGKLPQLVLTMISCWHCFFSQMLSNNLLFEHHHPSSSYIFTSLPPSQCGMNLRVYADGLFCSNPWAIQAILKPSIKALKQGMQSSIHGLQTNQNSKQQYIHHSGPLTPLQTLRARTFALDGACLVLAHGIHVASQYPILRKVV